MQKRVYIVGSIVLLLVVIAGGFVFMRSKQGNNSDTQFSVVAYTCESGKTAYELLTKKNEVITKETSFGKMVQGINGQEPKASEYWSFLVNGKLAPVGAEAYRCEGSEPIEWKLEKM